MSFERARRAELNDTKIRDQSQLSTEIYASENRILPPKIQLNFLSIHVQACLRPQQKRNKLIYFCKLHYIKQFYIFSIKFVCVSEIVCFIGCRIVNTSGNLKKASVGSVLFARHDFWITYFYLYK